MKTLYDFIMEQNNDFDTYDTVFDVEVTVCVPCETGEDYYDKFYDFILKHVTGIEKIGEGECRADWYYFVNSNIEVFKDISNELWDKENIAEDDDDFIYDWIVEIHGLLAGGASEDTYEYLMKKYADRFKEVDK